MVRVSCVFVDANVLLDVLWGRRPSSEELLKLLRACGIPIYTSYLVFLELIDKEQERMFVQNLINEGRTLDYILRVRKNRRLTKDERKEAVDKVYELLKEYGIELLVPRDEGIWETATLVMKDVNVESNDAFHIASAMEAGCNIFVTSDERLGKQVNQIIGLKWYKPDELLNELTQGKLKPKNKSTR